MRPDAGQGRRAFILLESKSEDFHIRMPLFTCILFKGGFLDFINRSLEAASSSWGYSCFTKIPNDDTIPGSGAFYLIRWKGGI